MKHYNYMQSVIPELIEHEKRIREIKNTPEFKRAFNYFHVLYNRGVLRENISSKNQYKIVVK